MKTNVLKYKVLLSLVCSLVHLPEAWARRLELSIESHEFIRAGLSIPQSVSYINLEKTTGDELTSLCPAKGFHIQPIKQIGDELASRSLRIRFSKGEPELDECLRGQACFNITPQKQKQNPGEFPKYNFKGRLGSYQLSLDAPSEISQRPLNCTSSALEIMQNSLGLLKFPKSLWVLNYRTEIVLLDAIEKRVWFRFRLPNRQFLMEKMNVALHAGGRMLISDQNDSFLFADFTLDKAILKTDEGIFESQFGLGGASFEDEWQLRYTLPFSFEKRSKSSTQQSRAPLFLGLSGFAKGEQFWSWENVINALKGTGGKPFSLGAPLIAGTERLADDTAEVFIAVKTSTDKASILSLTSGSSFLRSVRTDLRLDERAHESHFIIIGQDLYRHTADGVYKVDSSHERPSNLKGFKGSIEPKAHAFLSRSMEGKTCSLNVWPVALVHSGIFEPILGPLACSPSQALGVSPWGYSLSWRTGQKFKAVLSAAD